MKKISLILLLPLFFLGNVKADEGMWLPSLIHKYNIVQMKEMGFKLTAEDIYSINHSSIKDAIIALDHGSCSGELISNEGLFLTNHHCGFGEIQDHSSVEHDYLKDGFWAKSKDQELPNPGKTVSFLVRVEDVTEQVLEGITDDMGEDKRFEAIRAKTVALAREAKGDTHYETYVRSFFNDNNYYLFVLETFKDVRLVGAPPQSLGKFGGDTDNWMWPRHTCDFSMFRIYCAPDGTPAEYSKDNVPYQPKHFLPISLKGIEESDFAMVMGYPGRTNRYKTSYGVDYTMNVTNPVRVEVREKKLAIIGNYMKTSPKARIQYASKYARSSNYYKYSIGQNKGLNNLNVIDKKRAIEQDFTNWVNQNDARKDKYGEALNYIKDSYADNSASRPREYMIESLIRGPEIYYFAYSAYPLLELLKEPEANKEDIGKMVERIRGRVDGYFKNYHASTDKKLVEVLLKMYKENNDAQFYPEFLAKLNKSNKIKYGKYADKLFRKSIFDDKQELLAFLDNPTLKALKKDMALQDAMDIFSKLREITILANKSNKEMGKGRRLFVAGLREMNPDKNYYPDANSTMRLTYGNVKDYEPRDGVIYKYYTTTDGYLEKYVKDDLEFDVPDRMLELTKNKEFGRYADKNNKLRACFITTNDITGGNSGSGVMNSNGELIGCAFDGNWEAMSGDLAFEPDLQRCICVDIRFVLWVIDVYAGADNLINEMKIVE